MMDYGWLYNHTQRWWLTVAGMVVLGVTVLRYGFVAMLLAILYGLLLAFYVMRGVEETDAEEFGGRRPWADEDFSP